MFRGTLVAVAVATSVFLAAPPSASADPAVALTASLSLTSTIGTVGVPQVNTATFTVALPFDEAGDGTANFFDEFSGSDSSLGSAPLVAGVAQLALPSTLALGFHSIRAEYQPTNYGLTIAHAGLNIAPAPLPPAPAPPATTVTHTGTYTVTVSEVNGHKTKTKTFLKSYPSLSVRPSTKTVTRKTVLKVAVVVGSKVATPTGSVVVQVDGTQVRSATLQSGRATVRLPKFAKKGRHVVLVTYVGDTNFLGEKSKFSLKVR